MDQRLYILGGIAILVVVLLAYLVYAIASYRSALRRARSTVAVDDQADTEARYLSADAGDTGDLFAARTAPPAPREQTQPHEPSSTREVPVAEPPRVPLHIPEVRREGTTPVAPPRIPVQVSPDAEAETESSTEPEEPSAGEAVAPVAPTASSAPAAGPADELMSEPTPAEEAPVLPGYSLGDEIERLMLAAEQQQPLIPPVEHPPVDPGEPSHASEPTFEAPPLVPPPSIGQALSFAEPVPEPQPVLEPEPRPEPQPAPVPEPQPVPRYELVAPVELHFTAGPGRVGVKPGTRSHAEFQRLAAILLGDLHASRDR